MMTLEMKKILYVLSLWCVSIFLGVIYSIYNTDPHHWGFIVGTALDFIRGKDFFSEIFIQYGVGQAILFKILNYIFPINYTTVGIITAVIYATNFPVIFFCVRRISNSTQAILITSIAFLVHPFAIYPWPDYFAGLSLCFACYFLIKAKQDGKYRLYATSGIFLFLAFLFRNTYLLSIMTSIISFVLLSLFSNSLKKKGIYVVIGVFSGLLAGYLLFLIYQGNLFNWYIQDFGAAFGVYDVGFSSSVKVIFKFASYLVDPSFMLFFCLLIINIYMIIYALIDDFKSTDLKQRFDYSVLIFLCLLGCSGIFQALRHLEIFRLQSATVALYFGLAYFLKMRTSETSQFNKMRFLNYFFGALIFTLILKFPFALIGSTRANRTTIWPIISPSILKIDSFSKSEIPFFKLHRFQILENNYYQNLYKYVCDGKSRIVNLTLDSTIPYLCEDQDNALSIPFYDDQLIQRINKQESERLIAGDFREGEVIVTEVLPPINKNISLFLIGTISRPVSIRWMKPGNVLVLRAESANSN
jgi:hypothetical protein